MRKKCTNGLGRWKSGGGHRGFKIGANVLSNSKGFVVYLISPAGRGKSSIHTWHCWLGFASAHQGIGMSIGAKRRR